MPFMDAELNKEVGCIGLSIDKSILPQPHSKFSLWDKREVRNYISLNPLPMVPG